MTKKIYQATVGKESKTARAMTTNANISLKYSTEICNQIKGKNADKMLAWFHRIIAHEDFLPLKRYHKKVAHRKGIKAIIQPGGSIKDKDVIKACDKLGISMVFTGIRHFRH